MNNKPRVLHLCSNRWNSAISEYALSSVKALHQLDCLQEFSCLQGSPLSQRLSNETSAKTIVYENFHPWIFSKIQMQAELFSPDFVIAYGGPETFLMRFIKSDDTLKKIRFLGDSRRATKTSVSIWDRWSLGFCDALVSPSIQQQRTFETSSIEPLLEFIRLGISSEDFSLRHGPVRSSTAGGRILVFGRFDPVKGHGFALQAFKHLLSTWPSEKPRPQLCFVGKSANINAVQLSELAGRYGLTVGADVDIQDLAVSDVSGLLSSVDLGFVPSLGSELIGRVTEEFLVCGTPVVVSSVGALKECLTFAEAGESFDHRAGNSVEQAARLLGKWLDVAMRESLEDKKKRRDKALNYFSLEKMADAYQELFTKLSL